MIQRRQHPRFALKSRQPFGIVRERFRKNFDGYVAPEFVVAGLIHLSHPARTNGANNLIAA